MKHGHHLKCLALVAACLVSVDANAQPSLYTMKTEPAHLKNGDLFGKNVTGKVGPVMAAQYLTDFGRCILRRYSQFFPAFLAMVPGTAAARKKAEWLATSECVEDGAFTFNDILLRGSIYEAMYTAVGSKRITRSPEKMVSIDYKPPVANDDAALAQYLLLIQFADCVARASPASVDSLIGSSPGSAGEGLAFGEMSATLGGCARQGSQVKFSKVMLRGLLAEAAYRIANAPAMLASGRN